MTTLIERIKSNLKPVLHPFATASDAAEGRALLTELVEVNDHLQNRVKSLQVRVNTCECSTKKKAPKKSAPTVTKRTTKK